MDSVSNETPSDVISLGPLMSPTAIDTTLYLQARRIIQMTNQFVDDISVRYFQGIHRYLPIISRKRFHDYLIHVGAFPPASFSVLLLSICLVTYHPEILPKNPQRISRESLYITIKLVFTQIQAVFPPTVHLIQAGVLLALYEYAHGKPDDAFLSISGCARMGYATGLHHERPTHLHHYTKEEEMVNTWTGIIVLERLFFCELSARDQPFATNMSTHPQLTASEGDNKNDNMSRFQASKASIEMQGLGYSAQAAWLLDRVLKATKGPNMNTQFDQLDELGSSLQVLLGLLLEQCQDVWGVFCGATAIAIRALFILHWHILSQPAQPFSSELEEWRQKSYDTLDTVSNMVIDINNTHEDIAPHLIDQMPPSCVYITRAALKHIHDSACWKSKSWLWETEKQLNASLDQFSRRWGFETAAIKSATYRI
ncbi:hypothetical protein ABOM_004554 [Aspergillus bombycis]|uniref:Xylanolytic transcriptional activator regulatory domain-containing protein n=1 Tax=Aspergillus bombycis TaxID=109264 RepID=A0A1F8A3Y7_9EURO|nr:hypothetical protein ABOM_004554 [Aspergillus bombycis]OGM46450.1 hypothetical protein ABOM_004554 [Aspergillus bombycis]